MEVWAPVAAGVLSGLITALAGYLSGVALWKREREAAAETRRAEAHGETVRQLAMLRREVVAAFVDGRVALARLWALSPDLADSESAGRAAPMVEQVVTAGQRLALAGQQLGRQVGGSDAIQAANELTAAIMKVMESATPDDVVGYGYSSWASASGSGGGETKISALVDHLLKLT